MSNKYLIAILNNFRCDKNVNMLKTYLIRKFNNLEVYRFLNKNIHIFINNFANNTERELLYSNWNTTPSINNEVDCMNRKFIDRYSKLINVDILKYSNMDRPQETYNIGDGVPASGRTILREPTQNCRGVGYNGQQPVKAQTTFEMLQSWKNPSRGLSLREDTNGGNGAQSGNILLQNSNATHNYNSKSGYSAESIDNNFGHNGYRWGTGSHGEDSQHVSRLVNNNYARKFNGDVWYQNGWDIDTNERLLARNIFRKGHDGQENSIPSYNIHQHNRHYERDVEENIGGNERGNHVRGYGKDMYSLYCRLDSVKCKGFEFKAT